MATVAGVGSDDGAGVVHRSVQTPLPPPFPNEGLARLSRMTAVREARSSSRA